MAVTYNVAQGTPEKTRIVCIDADSVIVPCRGYDHLQFFNGETCVAAFAYGTWTWFIRVDAIISLS
jgi:hypothetical protein